MYIEYYIIENLLINYIIISCTSILIKRHTNEKKKWIGAFLGTIYSVAYLYPTLGVLFTLPFKLIIMTFIILTSFTYKDKKEFIRISLVFYLVNVFICGSTYFIIYFTGIEHMKISFLIVCTYISCELLKYIYRDIKNLKYITHSPSPPCPHLSVHLHLLQPVHPHPFVSLSLPQSVSFPQSAFLPRMP